MAARERYDLDALEEDGWGRRACGPLPEMDHTGGWKESQYDPRLGREIVRRVLCGETIRAITAEAEMPSYATLFQWLRVHADFRWRYQAARRHLAEGRVAQIALTEASRRAWPELRAKVEGGPVRRRGGRASSYDLRVARAFCELIAEGETVTAACARRGMPSVKVLYTWLRQRPEFRQMYAQARDHWLARLREQGDEALDLAVAGVVSARAVRAARRQAARLEGRIGRLTPKTYRPARTPPDGIDQAEGPRRMAPRAPAMEAESVPKTLFSDAWRG